MTSSEIEGAVLFIFRSFTILSIRFAHGQGLLYFIHLKSSAPRVSALRTFLGFF